MAVGKTPEYVAALAALEQELGSLGWKQGENLQIDDRWSAGSEDAARSAAQQMIALKPDVIVGQSAAVIQALLSDDQNDLNRFFARCRPGGLRLRLEPGAT